MDPISTLGFYWTCCHHIAAIFLNLLALGVLLKSWRRMGKLHDTRLPFVFSVLCTVITLTALVFAEFPRMYALWTHSNDLLGLSICQYLLVAIPISETVQTILASLLIIGAWMRQRKVSQFSSNLLPSGNCKRIIWLVIAAAIMSTLIGLSAAFQPQIGTSISLQDLHLLHKECLPKLSTLWSMAFRWMLGLFIPVFGIAFPLGLHLRMKYWPRCSRALKSYIQLSAAILLTNLMLQIPAFVEDLTHLMPLEDLPKLIGDSKNNHSFLHTSAQNVLSLTLPKLQFSCYPIGVLVILPWRQPKKDPKNSAEIQLNFLYRQTPKIVHRKEKKEGLKLISNKET